METGQSYRDRQKDSMRWISILFKMSLEAGDAKMETGDKSIVDGLHEEIFPKTPTRRKPATQQKHHQKNRNSP